MSPFHVDAADIWWRWVADATWQSAVVGIFILLIVALGKRWPSPLRYALLLIALLKFMTPPLWTAPTGLFSQMTPVVKQMVNGDASFRPNPFPVQPAPLSVRPSPEFADEGSNHKAAKIVTLQMEDQSSKSAPYTQTDLVISDTPPAVSTTTVALPRSRPSLPSAWTWKTWLMLTHLAGAAVVAILILKRIRQLRRLVAGTHPVTDERLPIIVKQLTRKLRIRRQVRLLCSANVTAPVSFGVIRPTVLLPGNTNNLKTSELTSVLAHELVHLSRGDAWLNWLQLFATAIWWFHPVVWILNRRIRQVREDCCDDAMLAAGIASETAYCETLLKVAAIPETTAGSVLTFSMAAGLHPVAKRMRRIMDPRVKRKARLCIAGVVTIIVMACTLLPGLNAVSQPIEAASDATKQTANAVQNDDGESKKSSPDRTERKDAKPVEQKTQTLRARVFLQNKQAPAKRFRIRVALISSFDGPYKVPDGQWRDIIADDDGSFTVNVVTPGTYRISAAADGFAPVESELFNTLKAPDVATDIVLNKGVTVEGEVVDENGQLVTGATVVSWSLAGDGMPPPAGEVFGDFASDEGAVRTVAGKFTLHDLPAKREVFRITHPDFHFPVIKEVDLSLPGTNWFPITLKRGCTIRGLVFDANGERATDETLHFQKDRHATRPGHLATTKTDAKGFYQVHQLPARLIHIRRDSKTGVTNRLVEAKAGEVQTVHLGGQRTLTGKALINGQPARNRSIELGEEYLPQRITTMITTTDADGNFTFYGPPPGVWTLCIKNDTSRHRMAVLTTVTVPVNGNVSLGNINRIEGSLSIMSDQFDMTSEDNQSRRFRLGAKDSMWPYTVPFHDIYVGRNTGDRFVIDNLAPGDFKLYHHLSESVFVLQKFSISADELNLTVNLKLPTATSSLSGTVHKSICRSGWDLQFWSEDERWFAHTRVAHDGTFEIKKLPAATWTVRVHPRRISPAIASVKIGEGENKHITIEAQDAPPLSRSGFAKIRVYLPNGAVTPCNISVEGPNGTIEAGPSVYGGRMIGGPPGTYEITASLKGFNTVKQTVEIPAVAINGRPWSGWKVDIHLTKRQEPNRAISHSNIGQREAVMRGKQPAQPELQFVSELLLR